MSKTAKTRKTANTQQREAQHDLPPLSLRAAVRPGTVDAEARTAEIVWSTGARVLRGFWERYYEELSLDPDHVRMDRLNNGAPFLDSHNGFELSAVMGVVEKASVDGKEGMATIRFARAEDDENADRIFRKVQDGIIQNISVGYRVYRFEQVEGGEEEIPVYRAVDWEPFELSAVPMGADDGAGFRAALPSGQRYRENTCTFVTRSQETTTMDDDEKRAAEEAKRKREAAEAKKREDETRAAEEKARKEGAQAERTRVNEIETALSAAKIDDADFRKELVDGDVPIDEARKRIIDKMAEADAAVQTDGRIAVGDDRERRGFVDGLTNALMNRAAPDVVELSEAGREYRGLTLMEIARQALEIGGVKTRGMGKMEVASLALGLSPRAGGMQLIQRAGYHSTSDFPLILADVANKTLRRVYDETAQTFKPVARETTIPDFKPVYRTQLGEAPLLTKVVEGAEFQRGTIGEGREQYRLFTYGKVFGVTRQTLINDDMDAFSRVPMLFGRSARHLESDLVWNEFLSNPTMGDGNTLFHANHSNVGTGVLGVPALSAGRSAMRQQKGLDGEQYINVMAKYILVPSALESDADQLVSTNFRADSTGNVNIFAGRLSVIAEPRFDAVSAAEWYLAADPADIDTLEYAYLEGEDGPFMESRIGFDVDGLEIKVRHDFAAKAIDWRGFYQSDGQAA